MMEHQLINYTIAPTKVDHCRWSYNVLYRVVTVREITGVYICLVGNWFKSNEIRSNLCPLFFIPLLVAFYALVKNGHWLIGRSDLNLHEICFVMITGRASSHRPINIFPSFRSSENVINHFASGERLFCYHGDDRIRVRACRAEKIPPRTTSIRRVVVTDLKQGAV